MALRRTNGGLDVGGGRSRHTHSQHPSEEIDRQEQLRQYYRRIQQQEDEEKRARLAAIYKPDNSVKDKDAYRRLESETLHSLHTQSALGRKNIRLPYDVEKRNSLESLDQPKIQNFIDPTQEYLYGNQLPPGRLNGGINFSGLKTDEWGPIKSHLESPLKYSINGPSRDYQNIQNPNYPARDPRFCTEYGRNYGYQPDYRFDARNRLPPSTEYPQTSLQSHPSYQDKRPETLLNVKNNGNVGGEVYYSDTPRTPEYFYLTDPQLSGFNSPQNLGIKGIPNIGNSCYM